MAKVRVINKGQNSDLIGGNFTNVASETVFTFGKFKLESNFAGKQNIDYSNELSSFVRPITLEDLALDNTESKAIADFTTNASLIFDRSDLQNFVKFGSTRELLRVSVEQIISKYPASIYANNRKNIDLNITFFDYTFDPLTDISNFKIPAAYIDNPYGLVFNLNNTEAPDGDELKNLNLSYFKYVIWQKTDPENNTDYIIGFTGDSISNPYVTVTVQGNPFSNLSGATTGTTAFHLKPEPLEYNKFRAGLNDIERYIIGDRLDNQSGFLIYFKDPTLLETGEIIYTDKRYTWTTSDGYNLDFSGSQYVSFLESLLNIGSKYDSVKTDLIARFLVPASIKTYDLTDEGKMTKLIRIYGREFDDVRQFIDSLVNINTVTYNKKNDIPTQLIKNLAKTLGWDVFSIVDAQQFDESFFSTEAEQEEETLLPAEVDLELWRRIIINTNYFWKSKGTRQSLKAMLLLIGIPEPFINITEYIYTVDGKINPDTVELGLEDLPSASLPYDSNGYPIAPAETDDFYFQISGNTDGGQAYMDNFRSVGFNLNRTVDNKKSWTESGYTERIHPSTPSYFQEDSQLVLNTKEIDATLDIARGVEFDVYCYIQSIEDYVNTGVTKPYIYINVPFDYGVSANTFTIPDLPLSGSAIQLNFNGITLTSGATGFGDYLRTGDQEVTLNTETAITHGSGEKDIITLTYLHDKLGSTGYTEVKYIVQAPIVSVDGTVIDLGEEPKGDVQLVVDGMSLSKKTSLYTGDFIINPNDRTKIIVQNDSLKTYLQSNPILRIWYIKDGGTASNAEKRSEILRVDSLSSQKLYYSAMINRYIYVLDFIAFDGDSIKITLNGLTLQNETDFTLNPSNKKEVILRGVVNLGDIIGAYYVVEDSSFSPPILPPDPVYSDIGSLSFLEFLELVNRRLINVRNRKTITDNVGGFYPTVLKLYEEYLKRSFRAEGDPLKSNGYTFAIVYPFIERYSSFFSKFVDQLLPATIIQRKGGVLIRNTVFTKQKFTYRRGVNFNPALQYLGDDSAEFIKTVPSSDCEWTDDYECLYTAPTTTTTTTTLPITTTTTTATPTGGVVFAMISNTNIYTTKDSGQNFNDVTPVGAPLLSDVDFGFTTHGYVAGTNYLLEGDYVLGSNTVSWTDKSGSIPGSFSSTTIEAIGRYPLINDDVVMIQAGSGDIGVSVNGLDTIFEGTYTPAAPNASDIGGVTVVQYGGGGSGNVGGFASGGRGASGGGGYFSKIGTHVFWTGSTYNPEFPTTSFNSWKFSFQDNNNGFGIRKKAGSGSQPFEILKTSDFGTNWTSLYDSTGDGYTVLGSGNIAIEIEMLSSTLGWASAGLNGVGMAVLKTTDGVNWTDLTPNIPPAVLNGNNIIAYDANLAYISATDGVYETTDGGLNWVKVNVLTGKLSKIADNR